MNKTTKIYSLFYLFSCNYIILSIPRYWITVPSKSTAIGWRKERVRIVLLCSRTNLRWTVPLEHLKLLLYPCWCWHINILVSLSLQLVATSCVSVSHCAICSLTQMRNQWYVQVFNVLFIVSKIESNQSIWPVLITSNSIHQSRFLIILMPLN